MESVTNLFYVTMAVYGWWNWRYGRSLNRGLPVTIWPIKTHGVAVFLLIIAAAISGTLLSRYTDAAYPYVDSLTTFSAFWATFLVARKVFENWWYWLVIDVISIVVFWIRELELTAMLFVIYVVLIPFGMVQWHRSYRRQTDV